jgi:hypothetical protein
MIELEATLAGREAPALDAVDVTARALPVNGDGGVVGG